MHESPHGIGVAGTNDSQLHHHVIGLSVSLVRHNVIFLVLKLGRSASFNAPLGDLCEPIKSSIASSPHHPFEKLLIVPPRPWTNCLRPAWLRGQLDGLAAQAACGQRSLAGAWRHGQQHLAGRAWLGQKLLPGRRRRRKQPGVSCRKQLAGLRDAASPQCLPLHP